MSDELAAVFSNPSRKSLHKRGSVEKEDVEKKNIQVVSSSYGGEEEDSLTTGSVLEPDIQIKTFWDKVYYNWLVVDKAYLGTSLTQSFLNNHDLKPVEEERRVWSWYNFGYFWLADCFNINTWQVAATGLQLGLNWWQCWITVWIGYGLVGLFVMLASRCGSSYHLSFPISVRASFGIYFSMWPIINRVVMAIVWYAVQAYLGGSTVSLMLKSIFGRDLNTRIPDHFNSPNCTTYEFMCFFIFWVGSIPFLLVAPHKIRHLFTAKAVMVPFAAFGFLIWAVKKSHGKIALGSLNDTTPHGSEFNWIMLRSLIGCLANFATLIVNAPDFARFSKTKNSSLWVQLIAIPFLFSITCLIGIIVTAAGYELYGINYWSPIDVLAQFLETTFTKGTRAGVFLISFVFTVAQLGTNISANSLSCGTDMTALFPRFINIRRGSLFCAAIALCICPWNLLATSNKFTMALSAYAIFLSSIAGIVCCDYFLVRRGYVKLTHLYSNQKGSFYMYNKYGINWRAGAAYLCGIAPNLPGFIGTVGAPAVTVSQGALNLYYCNYFVGYCISFFIYGALCYFFPIAGTPVKNILTEPGFFQRWAEVEDFDHEWKLTLQKGDLTDEVVDVYEYGTGKSFF